MSNSLIMLYVVLNSLVRRRSSVIFKSIFSKLFFVSNCANSQSYMIFLASFFFYRRTLTSCRISLKPSQASRFLYVYGSSVLSTLCILNKYSTISFFFIGYFRILSEISLELSLGIWSSKELRGYLASWHDFLFLSFALTLISSSSIPLVGDVTSDLSWIPDYLILSFLFYFANLM